MITIDLLKNHQECVPALTTIWHEQLGKTWMPDLPTSYTEQLINSWTNDNTLPLAHIALKDGKAIAVASLQKECGIRPDLTPWLGSLVVDQEYQKQGIGKSLIETTKHKARALGFSILYLFTFDPTIINYYLHLNWTIVATDQFNKHPVTIMSIDL